MIVINFKNYKTGKNVLELAKKIEKHLPSAIAAVPPMYLGLVSFHTKLRAFAQHIDSKDGKRSTGFILPESVKKAGAKGSLLNHSEHKISIKEMKKTIKNCNKLNLKIIACSSNLPLVKKIKKLKPLAIAFEDPKLIATGKSITKYNPDSIRKFVSLLKNTKIIPLCGAGINSAEDYHEALKLGCRGVLISSAIANSKNPEKFLKKLNIYNKK